MTDSELLRRAAERAAGRPFFLASALLPYARAEGLDDDALAEQLGCPPGELPAILLCRRPSGEGSMFRADVKAIADRFRLDATRLARMLRAADSLEAFGGATTGGLLTAARDRGDPESNAPSDPSTDEHIPIPSAEPSPDDESRRGGDR